MRRFSQSAWELRGPSCLVNQSGQFPRLLPSQNLFEFVKRRHSNFTRDLDSADSVDSADSADSVDSADSSACHQVFEVFKVRELGEIVQPKVNQEVLRCAIQHRAPDNLFMALGDDESAIEKSLYG